MTLTLISLLPNKKEAELDTELEKYNLVVDGGSILKKADTKEYVATVHVRHKINVSANLNEERVKNIATRVMGMEVILT